MHLDIAAHEWLRLSETDFYQLQVSGPLLFRSLIRTLMGYWRQRVDESLGNSPQGNREPLVVMTRMQDPR